MKKIISLDKSGAAAIEYALIASLIAVVAITGMQKIGNAMKDKFSDVATTLQSGATS